MADILTQFTALAVSVYRAIKIEKPTDPAFPSLAVHVDPVIEEVQHLAWNLPYQSPDLKQFVAEAFSMPELAMLASREGELDPMMMHPYGGVRVSPDTLILGLFAAALQKIHLLGLPDNERTFVLLAHEGFDDVLGATRGEKIKTLRVKGIARITLQSGVEINTPWGIVRPAPEPKEMRYFSPFGPPPTRCILSDTRLTTVSFDRAQQPQSIPPEPMDLHSGDILLPLTYALATPIGRKPQVPIVTWSTVIFPFQVGFSYSYSHQSLPFGIDADVSEYCNEIEEWARAVSRSHSNVVDVAARRFVSAVGGRTDPADALIDAVMAWENLVGTSSETSFRVTASLAKLLEPDGSKRIAKRKELNKIYNVRSRLVHGEIPDNQTLVESLELAIDTAASALRKSYSRGRSWLEMKSTERADKLLLEDE